MDEDHFWRLIEAARSPGGTDCDTMHDLLRDSLKALPLDEIVEFDNFFARFLRKAFRYDLKDAYRLMTGSGSDDGFTDFRSWLIGQGQSVYYKALDDPDTLADVELEDDDDAECEQLAYAALHAYEDQTGEAMPAPPTQRSKIEGHQLSDQELSDLLPELCRKYNYDTEIGPYTDKA